MTGVGEVVAVLAVGLGRVRDTRALLARASACFAQAHARLAGTVAGSRDARADAATSLLTDAHARLQQADAALSHAVESVTRYVSAIGGHLPAVDVGKDVQDGNWSTLAPSSPGQVVPEFVARVAERLREILPRGAKTVGVLATVDGTTRSRPIWSGEDGPAAGAPGLRRDSPRRWHQNAAATQHVEGHAAAIMRRPDGPRHAVLVVSKRPCPGELGCHRLLPELLPAGATLTVYMAGKDDTLRMWKTYLGTGKGVPT